jgi:hypothetical protein
MRVACSLSSPSVVVRASRVLVGLGLLSLTLAGCERKAPGPVECSEFAEEFVQHARDDARTTPSQEADIDTVTQLCLTVPYDRELIACAQSTHRARACFDVYKQRVRSAR